AWSIDREVGALAQLANARAVLTPIGESGAPPLGFLGCERLRREAAAPGVILVDPGLKIRCLQLRERQQQVGQVSLGIDDDRRYSVNSRFLQQPYAQACLAAACHTDTGRMGQQILRVVQDQLVFSILSSP